MNGTRCPTLFGKWHGIFYMSSRLYMTGHTKAFDYPALDHWRGVDVLWPGRRVVCDKSPAKFS